MSRETPVCFELKKTTFSVKARAARQANRPDRCLADNSLCPTIAAAAPPFRPCTKCIFVLYVLNWLVALSVGTRFLDSTLRADGFCRPRHTCNHVAHAHKCHVALLLRTVAKMPSCMLAAAMVAVKS